MKLRSRASVVVAALLLSATARAGIIEYDVTNVSGSTWRYDYTVTNDTVPSGVWEFTVWFANSLYDTLAVASTPAGWDSIVAQPDANLPADGFFDSLALTNRLPLNGTLSGFGVTFNWLGAGTPGSQLFQFVDPERFDVIDGGLTRLRNPPTDPDPTPVPEPSVPMLLAAALAAAFIAGRRRARAR